MQNTATQIIETERLLLRPFVTSDANSVFNNFAKDPAVTKYLRWNPHKNVTESKQLVNLWVKQYQTPEFYQWAICKKDGTLIGCIGISLPSPPDNLHYSLGYCFGKEFWGHGYATESLQAVVNFIFATSSIKKLEACHAIQNPESGTVLKKVGFTYSHTGHYYTFNNEKMNAYFYTLEKRE